MDLDLIESDVIDHGEVHVVVEEHEHVAGDEYIGLRKGNATFDKKNGLIRVDDGKTVHNIDSDRIVYYHVPKDFPD